MTPWWRSRRVGSAMKTLRSLVREEGGQTIALVTIMLLTLMGVVAIVVDVAVFAEEKRQLQNAADAAALATVRELPGDPAAGKAAAKSYLTANGYTLSPGDVTVSITTPYASNPELAEVVLTNHDVPYLFARVLGFISLDISARAVGEVVTGWEDDYAIFASDTSCGAPGVEISGTLATFDGTVHANSNVDVSGNTHTFDPSITYACTFTEGGGGHSYGHEQKKTGQRDYPAEVASLTFASFAPCNFSYPNPINLKSRNEVWLDPAKTQLVRGVYCFDRTVTLIGDDITGDVTFVARGAISISGSDHNLTPYHPSGILLYSEESAGPSQINVSASGGTYAGILYAPNGDIDFTGQSNHTFEGSLVAENVKVSGTGLTIRSGTLVQNANPVVRLAE